VITRYNGLQISREEIKSGHGRSTYDPTEPTQVSLRTEQLSDQKGDNEKGQNKKSREQGP
jgi:hypothetical protein